MKVRAKRKGVYGNKMMEVGDEFELKPFIKKERGEKDKEISAESQFSEIWMEKAEAKKAEKKEDPKKSSLLGSKK